MIFLDFIRVFELFFRLLEVKIFYDLNVVLMNILFEIDIIEKVFFYEILGWNYCDE